MSKRSDQAARFEKRSQQRQGTLIGQFLGWFLHNKKWWLLPIVVVLGLLVVIGGTGMAPFLYTLL